MSLTISEVYSQIINDVKARLIFHNLYLKLNIEFRNI